MTTTEHQPRSTATWAIVLNAGMIVIPVMIGYLFSAIIKLVNPSGVDVTHGLAYLQPILIVSYGLLAVAIILAVIVNISLSRKRHPSAQACWIIFAVQLIASIAVLLAQLLERVIAFS